MGAKKHNYSFKDIFWFGSRFFVHLMEDLIDGCSAWNRKNKLKKFNIWHFVGPPVDSDADDTWKWLINEWNLCALTERAILSPINTFFFRLLEQ
jgi:hypothetical protein